MPTIKQLPVATAVTAGDLLPISQDGLTRSVSVSGLLANTQPAVSLAQGTLLGRSSSGLGGPEAVGLGLGLAMRSGSVVAAGDDHLQFSVSPILVAGDEVIVNSNAMPKRMAATALRSLFSAGPGVAIDSTGVISAVGGSGGSGTVGPQGAKGDPGPQGQSGQGFNFRGSWQSNTAYAAYDVVTYGGQTFVATTSLVSTGSFASPAWSLLAAQGAVGAQGQAGPTTPATFSSVGAIKPGSGLSVATDGTLSIASVNPAAIAQGGAGIGQILGWTGTTWGPTTVSAGATYSGAAPINVTAGLISLSQNGATAGQVLTWSGTAWAPQPAPAAATLGSSSPAMDGVASAGVSVNATRDDHRHPTDSTRAPITNPAFTGSLTLPSWTTTARPSAPVAGMEGYATDTARRETYTPSGWVQYVRSVDIPAASGQLLGGTSAAGSAVAITLGTGLALAGTTLSATSAYTLPSASATVLGGVKQGAGVTIASDGTISATGTSGVGTFNSRSGTVTLTLSDVSGVVGVGAAARTNLGLATIASSGSFSDLTGVPVIPAAATATPVVNGTASVGVSASFARADHVHGSDPSRLAVSGNLSDLGNIVSARANLGLGVAATLNVGTAAGMVAAANDSRIIGAVQTSAIPAASGQLLGGSGTPGAPVAISLGSGLALSGGTLSATAGNSYALPTASTTTLGGVKSDGNTVQVATDGTLSVAGLAITSLTDISSGPLGGPALSDIDTLNRAGTDYRVTLSARSMLFRKTPAGSRTITLASNATVATLTGADNDKTVVVAGSAAGSLTVDGTIADGFRCQVINHTGSALVLSGISGLGATSVANGSSCWVTLANSAVEATLPGTGAGSTYTLPVASTSQLGGVKPDGSTLTTTSDGTLSVVTIATHALAAGTSLAPADEFAMYSASSSADVKYSAGQVATFVQSNLQSWGASARPMLGGTQFGLGFNTTLGRFEFWNGTTWNQHCRVSDFTASATQLYAGSSTGGVATPINIGSGLTLTGTTLNAAGGTSVSPVPVITASASGSSQSLAFPASGNRAYDVTLTANCSLALAGGTPGELQTITLVIRGGAGGFSANLPPAIKWPGGMAPNVDTSAGSYNEFYVRTIDGGATYSGNY